MKVPMNKKNRQKWIFGRGAQSDRDIHWPPGVYRDYGLWRAVMTIEGDSIVGEGASAEYAMRECLQKYALRHGGELP